MPDTVPDSAQKYATEVCTHLKEFLDEQNYELIVGDITREGAETQIAFTLLDTDTDPDDSTIEPDTPDFTQVIQVNGEHLTIGIDEQHYYITSTTTNWTQFNYQQHAGELINHALRQYVRTHSKY